MGCITTSPNNNQLDVITSHVKNENLEIENNNEENEINKLDNNKLNIYKSRKSNDNENNLKIIIQPEKEEGNEINKKLSENQNNKIDFHSKTTKINVNTNSKLNKDNKDNNNETIFEKKVDEKQKITKAEITKEDRQILIKIFNNHFLFRNKSEKVITKIIDALESMELKADSILFSKGESGCHFYIIKEGEIELKTEAGNKYLTNEDTFGELALIQNKKRTCTARISKDCKLFLLNGKIFREIVSKVTENDLKERMLLLASCPVFNSLENNELNAIANSMIKCYFEKEQIVLYEGDIGQSMYLIKSGIVKCYKDLKVDDSNLEGKSIRILGPKDYFGEGSILFHINRTSSVYVEEQTECFQISESHLKDILGVNFQKIIISSIIKNAFKTSKYLTPFCLPNFFKNVTDLIKTENYKDFKDDEIVISGKSNSNYHVNTNKKFYILLSGNLKEKCSNEIVSIRGSLYGDELIKNETLPRSDIIATDDLKVIELDWKEVLDKLEINCEKKKIFSVFSKIEALKSISLFKETQFLKLVDIVNMMKKEKFKADEVIFKEGEIGNKLYMIKKGKVNIIKNERFIRELGEGNCFGEVALLFNEPRTATVKSAGDTKVYTLTKSDFTSVVDDNMLTYLANKMTMEDGFSTNLNDLYYVKSLGHGKFGNVCLVHNGKSFFAIKAVNRKAAEKQKILIKYFIQERNILLTLQHPFIMKLVKTLKTEENIFFLLEYIAGKTMSKYLNTRTPKQYFNSIETTFYIANILVSIDYLNINKICHRDLKPDNIIIDEKGYLKLIDFGNSIKLKEYTNTITGTPHYIAPEILLGKGYGFSCDYWSIGIIAYEIYYGNFPFGKNAKDPIDVYREIIKKDLIYGKGDNKIIQMIKSFLTKKVSDRICCLEKAKNLEAFQIFNWDDLLDFKIVPQFLPKKSNFKDFSEYNEKFLKYFLDSNDKNKNRNTVLSSYQEDDQDYEYDPNWAEIF